MTHSTKLAVYDIAHFHIVTARPHLEAQFMMAHFAAEPLTMKPVRKNNGAHALFLCISVKHDISVFGKG